MTTVSEKRRVQLLFQAARVRPRRPFELWHWVNDQYGLPIPYQRMCQGHDAPFDYISGSFFDDKRGWTKSETKRYNIFEEVLVQANRGGAKTECGAVLSHLDCVFHEGPQELNVRILGGSEDQSMKMYDYFERKTALEQFQPLLTKGQQSRRKTKWLNGASVEILVQSTKSVRGPRVQSLRLDEIDEFDPDVWKAVNYVTFEQPGSNRPSRMECLSTWHKPVGIFQQTLEHFKQVGIPVMKWCLMETIERCSEDWLCSECIVHEWCQGRAKKKPADSGYITVREARKQIKRAATVEDVESELFCMRPKAGSLVYPNFDRERNGSDMTHDPDTPLYASMDFGWEEFACVWFHRTPGNEIVFIDEYVSKRKHNAIRIGEITARCRKHGYNVIEWYGDPAGKAMSAQTRMSEIEQFHRGGILVIGLLCFDGLLSEVFAFREAIGGIGEEPRIRVNVRKCHRLAEAIENYTKDEDTEKPKERQPWSHLADAARYGFRGQGRFLVDAQVGFGRSPMAE